MSDLKNLSPLSLPLKIFGFSGTGVQARVSQQSNTISADGELTSSLPSILFHHFYMKLVLRAFINDFQPWVVFHLMQVPRNRENDDGTVPVELRGTEEAIEKARQMIEELLRPPTSYRSKPSFSSSYTCKWIYACCVLDLFQQSAI